MASRSSSPPAQADVVVVGGGAVGLCTAFFLRRAGREVTLLSREPIGIGASSGNAGMLTPSHVVPLSAPGVVAQGLRWLAKPDSPFYITPRLDVDLMRWLWTFRRHSTEAHVRHGVPILRDLSLASVRLFEEIQDTVGDVAFAPTGLLMTYRTDKARKGVLADAAIAEAAGLDVERLDAAGLRDLEPGLVTPAEGAVYYRQDARVDPDAFLSQLSAWLRDHGVAILDGMEVEAVADGSVRTASGTIRAEAVVLAAGAWTGRLAKPLGGRVPVQPARGYSLTLPSDHALTIPTILTDEKTTVTPMPGRLRFTGTLGLAGFDPSVDARRAEPIRRLARAYAPDAEVEAVETWSGFRPCSPDGLPIVGPTSKAPTVILATGHGMLGVSLAPITGQLVAEIVAGGTPAMAAPLHPARFGR